MRILLALVLMFWAALPVQAEKVVAGLSRDQVSITANFDGSDILIYGAVKREKPIPDQNALHVIITVLGPKLPVAVRRKDRRLGIWVNTDSVQVDQAPSFYAVATTGSMSEVLSTAEDALHKITIPRAIRMPNTVESASKRIKFKNALIRIRTEAKLFQHLEGSVNLFDETLFSTKIDLPANLVEGDYTTKIYLTRGGRIIDEHTTVILVRKVGLERWIFNLAHEKPLIYGLLSLFIAITAGWLASAIFRFARF